MSRPSQVTRIEGEHHPASGNGWPAMATRRCLLTCLTLAVGASGAAAEGPRRPDARVVFEQLQGGYIGSAGGGAGTLHHHGRAYRFSLASGGIGGLGAATVRAEGDVFNLRHIRDFPGEYVQVRSGVTLGAGSGEVWLRNAAGVEMHLRVQRTGLMLNFGADVVMIRMD